MRQHGGQRREQQQARDQRPHAGPHPAPVALRHQRSSVDVTRGRTRRPARRLRARVHRRRRIALRAPRCRRANRVDRARRLTHRPPPGPRDALELRLRLHSRGPLHRAALRRVERRGEAHHRREPAQVGQRSTCLIGQLKASRREPSERHPFGVVQILAGRASRRPLRSLGVLARLAEPRHLHDDRQRGALGILAACETRHQRAEHRREHDRGPKHHLAEHTPIDAHPIDAGQRNRARTSYYYIVRPPRKPWICSG
jgi:hypothetical protein